ncbi:MAG: hypothetical protein KJ629_04790 [Candidatus Omnitrophica bacterium]|nr:hypothetical protein [Candidatus Omnitrophota bacterium]
MKFVLFFFLVVFPLNSAFSLFQLVEGIEDAQIKKTAISFLDPALIYVASKNSLYKSQDKGETFKKVSVFKDEEIQHIFFDSYLANTFYAVTSRHLFKITDKTEKLFTAVDEELIYTVAKHKGRIYVGTSEGLYCAEEDILNWRKLKGLKDEISVYHIEPAKEKVYLATSKGVYLLKSEDEIKRVFIIRESEEEDGLIADIIKVDIFDEKKVWLGTNRGLFGSSDAGGTWKKLYVEGINNLPICSFAQTKLERKSLYVGTTKGFFRVNLETKTSKQIFEGIYAGGIFWVEFSPKGELYLSTSRGLFKGDYFTSSCQSKSLGVLIEQEPSIEEIQQAALRYNEVHPDKIRKWRNALKYRALFPEVSLDFDKTITTALGVGHSRVQVGPQDWGINLKWDVGDLIWNPSQASSIDTRSKLNTQLRLDILDEINRVYFERLRLKREIFTSSFSDEELFQKSLRLKELTAILNGYTGEYFSRCSNEGKPR